jgi:hypothetical protein
VTIDYRWEYGSGVWKLAVTISNHNSLSSSENGVNPGIRSLKSTYLNEPDVRSHWSNLFHKNVKNWYATTSLIICSVQFEFIIWHYQTPY